MKAMSSGETSRKVKVLTMLSISLEAALKSQERKTSGGGTIWERTEMEWSIINEYYLEFNLPEKMIHVDTIKPII